MSSLSISRIRIDGGTQTRECVRPEIVAEYAEVNEMPAVVVFYDGTDYWLADGFHRLDARKLKGKGSIECDIRQGTRRDAILFSLGANDTHGLRRSNADKRRAVQVVFDDEEWSKQTDRWIAETCGVSHTFVAGMRPQLATVANCEDAKPPKRTGRDGGSYKATKPPTADPVRSAAAERVARQQQAAPVAAENPEDGDCPYCRGSGRMSKKKIAAAKFIPPTLEEVAAYCHEARDNDVDPEQWMDHYTSNGWKVGKNPMKDWKGAVRTWERSDFRSNGKQKKEDPIGTSQRWAEERSRK